LAGGLNRVEQLLRLHIQSVVVAQDFCSLEAGHDVCFESVEGDSPGDVPPLPVVPHVCHRLPKRMNRKKLAQHNEEFHARFAERSLSIGMRHSVIEFSE
jgi:hypothetical protein